MSEGWRRIALGEVLEQTARPVAVSTLTEVRYAGARWYAEGVYPREAVPAESVKAKTLTELRDGDITYNRMWATKASFGVAHEDVDGCHVTNDFPIFTPVDSEVIVDFIELTFGDAGFQAEAEARATGTTERRRLKERDFLSIPINLPPLAEQRRIVDLIEAVDDAIEAAEVESAASQSAWQTLCEVVKSRDDSIVRSVDQVVDVARSGGTPSRAIEENFGGGIPWLKSGEVRGRCITAVEESISEQGLLSSAAWLAPAGSVLVAMYGGGTVGQVGRLGTAMTTNQAVLALVADPSEIDEGLLYHLLASESARLAAKATGAAQANISKRVVLAHEIGVPPLPLQRKLGAMADAALDAADAARAESERLRDLRVNLLTALLSGEHEIPASYDRFIEEAA